MASRCGWRAVDAQLNYGDFLVFAALDRLGRRSFDVMGKIYELVNSGVRPRTLAVNEAWVKGLDADPDSVEWMAALLMANCFDFRTRQGLERARAVRKAHRPSTRLDEEQITAIQQDLALKTPVAAINRRYGIPRSTLRDALHRNDR